MRDDNLLVDSGSVKLTSAYVHTIEIAKRKKS